MATTGTPYNLPYQLISDAPHGPNLGQTLADAVHVELARVDADIEAITDLTTVPSTQNTAGTSISTLYTDSLGAGTACGVAFTAPPSGMVMLFYNCDSFTSTPSFIYAAPRVGEGSTPGGGAEVVAAADVNAIKHQTNVQTFGLGRSLLVPGLTPGGSYNAQLRHRVSAGEGTWANKSLIVQPQL